MLNRRQQKRLYRSLRQGVSAVELALILPLLMLLVLCSAELQYDSFEASDGYCRL